MLRNERHMLILIVDDLTRRCRVAIFVKFSARETIRECIVQMVRGSGSAESHLHTGTMTSSGVCHDSSEPVVAGHHRQLLITDLHIESCHIEVNQSVE